MKRKLLEGIILVVETSGAQVVGSFPSGLQLAGVWHMFALSDPLPSYLVVGHVPQSRSSLSDVFHPVVSDNLQELDLAASFVVPCQ